MAEPTAADLKKMLQEEKAARGALEAKLEVLLQQVSTKSEPERIALAEKQALAAKRKEVKDAAIAVAKAQGKGKSEKVTHVRYVTNAWYHRKGTNYPPRTVLKIPVTEEPAIDWEPWQPPRITRPTAIDPDAQGTPYGEPKSAHSAIAALRKEEAQRAAVAAGDVVVSRTAGSPETTPDQGEEQPPASVEEHEQRQAAASEQGPEAGSALTRASDTDVG